MKKILLFALLSFSFYAQARNYCTQENLDIQLELLNDLKYNFANLQNNDLDNACSFEYSKTNCSKIDIFINRYNQFLENEAELIKDMERSQSNLISLEVDCSLRDSQSERIAKKSKDEVLQLIKVITSKFNNYAINKSDCREKIVNFNNFCNE